MIDFAYPWVLFAFLLLPLLYMYLVYWRRRPSLVVSTVRPFLRAKARRRATFTQWCVLLAAAVLILALARPRYGDEKVLIRSQASTSFWLDMSGA